MHIYYYSEDIPESALVAALEPLGEPKAIKSNSGQYPYDERFDFMIPAERGGGGDEVFIDAITVIIAFATVGALREFLKGFLTRTGELASERLFKPASASHRAATIKREMDWEVRAEAEIKASAYHSDGELSQKDMSHIRLGWKARMADRPRPDYQAVFTVDLFVDEVKQYHQFTVTYDPVRERAVEAMPFKTSPSHRFWQEMSIQLRVTLEKCSHPDQDAAAYVDKARTDRASLRKALIRLRR